MRLVRAICAAALAVFITGPVPAEHIVVGCIGDYGSGSASCASGAAGSTWR